MGVCVCVCVVLLREFGPTHCLQCFGVCTKESGYTTKEGGGGQENEEVEEEEDKRKREEGDSSYKG